jgi:hypothetical protein
MELELGQLDLRYESLRTRSALRERRVLASIAQVGDAQRLADRARAMPLGGQTQDRISCGLIEHRLTPGPASRSSMGRARWATTSG